MFPESVLPVTEIVAPSLSMAPPNAAELPERVTPLTVSVPRLRMAPPSPSRPAEPLGLLATPLPLMMFRLTRLTVVPAATSNTREEPPPLTVGVREGTLSMVTFLFRKSSPFVSTMGLLMAAVNWIVSPLWAWATAYRRV